MHSFIHQRSINILVNGIIKSRLKSKASQNPQRIIRKSDQRLKRCSNNTILYISNSPLCPILNLLSINIKKQTVYGEISTKGVSEWGSYLLNYVGIYNNWNS